MPASDEKPLPLNIPAGIARPAQRALDAAGLRTLTDVSKLTRAQLLELHGVGPRAIRLLQQALDEHGLQFACG